jgi:hypothetical protein
MTRSEMSKSVVDFKFICKLTENKWGIKTKIVSLGQSFKKQRNIFNTITYQQSPTTAKGVSQVLNRCPQTKQSGSLWKLPAGIIEASFTNLRNHRTSCPAHEPCQLLNATQELVAHVRTDKSGTVHDRGEQMFASGCWM